jgi:ADP-ribose pyrophosphatase YjhB (NUDIX family)
MTEPLWLSIARELRAIAQTGLTFSKNRYDRDLYERVRELSASLMAHGSNASLETILELFQRDTGYPTPKVDVRGAAFVDGRILMVREVSDGKWTLPGGWADVNQSPAECVVREIQEESGFEARAVKLAAVHDYRKSAHPPCQFDSIYKMFFLCDLTGGSARPSTETSDVSFFSRSELPALSLQRTTAAQIDRMFDYSLNPNLPTEFH